MGYLFGVFLFYTNMITIDDFEESYQGQLLSVPSFIEIHISEKGVMIPLFRGPSLYNHIEEKEIDLLIKALGKYKENINEIDEDIDELNEYICNSLNASYFGTKKESIKKSKGGFIYLFKCENTNSYKIGRTSKSISSRISQLKTANPYINEVLSFKTDDVSEEAMWHERFKDKNINREWFNLSQEDIKEMEDYYKNKEK